PLARRHLRRLGSGSSTPEWDIRSVDRMAIGRPGGRYHRQMLRGRSYPAYRCGVVQRVVASERILERISPQSSWGWRPGNDDYHVTGSGEAHRRRPLSLGDQRALVILLLAGDRQRSSGRGISGSRPRRKEVLVQLDCDSNGGTACEEQGASDR